MINFILINASYVKLHLKQFQQFIISLIHQSLDYFDEFLIFSWISQSYFFSFFAFFSPSTHNIKIAHVFFGFGLHVLFKKCHLCVVQDEIMLCDGVQTRPSVASPH